MNLCDKALLQYFVNYSGADAVWFLTHVQSKWEKASDYLTRLQLSGFKHDPKIYAPMGIRDMWPEESFFAGYTLFDVPYEKPLRETHWSEATTINKKAHTVHRLCIESGIMPLFVLTSHSDGFLPSKIAVETEAEGVIVSGLWTIVELTKA